MKKIRNSHNTNSLFLLLLVGIVLCFGGYRIFSFLCEVPEFLQVRNIVLAVVSAAMFGFGFLLAYQSWKRLRYLRDHPEDGEDASPQDEE